MGEGRRARPYEASLLNNFGGKDRKPKKKVKPGFFSGRKICNPHIHELRVERRHPQKI